MASEYRRDAVRPGRASGFTGCRVGVSFARAIESEDQPGAVRLPGGWIALLDPPRRSAPRGHDATRDRIEPRCRHDARFRPQNRYSRAIGRACASSQQDLFGGVTCFRATIPYPRQLNEPGESEMTTGDTSRPPFRAVSQDSTPETPEVLWNDLRPVRRHEFLRGPQQEVIREYPELVSSSDVALELPTGTGKTAVALLIAEWRRRRYGRPVTYLTLTNQLAGQALEEASRLGLRCADLRGTRSTRDRAEEGRYATASAVGITTYSNLFNVNPVVAESDLLVLDDVHGGEEFVANMWTVRVPRSTSLYDELLAALGPALSIRQRRSLDQGGTGRSPDIVHLAGAHQCVGCSQRSDSDPISVDGQRLCPLNSSAKMSSRAGRCSVDDAAPWRPGGPPAST